MTTEEKKTIQGLIDAVNTQRQSAKEIFDLALLKVTEANAKLEKKLEPVYLEKDILVAAQLGIQKAIQDVLGGYSSPLTKLVIAVIEENQNELRGIIRDSFSQVIRKEDFKQSIISAFSHKVAKTIISNNDGLFDKVSNELKQDSVFKAKMAIAVSNVVEECLPHKGIQTRGILEAITDQP